MANKPYRVVGGFDQAPDEADYRDLVRRTGATSMAAADTMAATATTIVYSTYSFPMTTAGDILGHDGTSIVRKAVGTQDQVLAVDTTAADSTDIAWKTLNTTKGDLLGYDTTLKRVPIGTNDYVLMADSVQTLGLKWAALTTTKGDLLGHNGSDPIRVPVGDDQKVLVADSTDAEGVTWAYASAFPGGIVFGSGEDGSLTLVANTVLSNSAANMQEMQYTTLDIASYTFNQEIATDYSLHIRCSVLLTGNGGTIFTYQWDAGSGGGAGTAGSGAGGAGVGYTTCLIVFARKTTGTGYLRCDGRDGNPGGAASAPSATANGAAGTAGDDNIMMGSSLAVGVTGVAAQGSGGNSAGTVPAAAIGSLITNTTARQMRKTPMPAFMSGEVTYHHDFVATANDDWNGRSWRTPNGAGGGAGGRNNGGAQGGGGGNSAAGNCGMWSQAVDGGRGGTGAAGGSGAGGGGGSSGGPGGFVCFVTLHCSSGWTLSAKGGIGGNGGAGHGWGGGGGAAPGGGGGFAVAALGSQSNAVTFDVSGGASGTGGAHGASGGNDGGVPASAATVGRSVTYVL